MAQKDSEELKESKFERQFHVREFNQFLESYFNWIVVSLVVIIFIFGFFMLLLPKYEQTVSYVDVFNKQQSSDTLSRQDELSKTQQLIANYGKIDKKYIAEINSIAPSIQNKEELFSEINYLVSVNQLILQSVGLSEEGAYQDQGLQPIARNEIAIASGIKMVNINLSLSGVSYEALKNFLSVLENNLRLMDVFSVSYSPSNNTANLVIGVYYSSN
jgi:hypothetical protein